jgi:hypothetical protein
MGDKLEGNTMSARNDPDGHATAFRNGELVEVKSVEEILSTLDERGRLEALPFMPEMLAYSGKRFRVYKQAIKFCDTKDLTGYHRMRNAVHLENLRCDGSGHGGCQAGCLLYWKEAWLRPVKSDEQLADPSLPQPGSVSTDSSKPIPVPDVVVAGTRIEDPAEDGEAVYSCQATDLTRAGPERLPWWDVRMYVRDVRSGNVGLLPMLRGLLVMLFNKFQGANRRFLPGLLLIQNGKQWPFIKGRLTKTPKETIGLQPGELVEVKSREEIFRTLDTKDKNRGLMFDVEMLRYCGKQARVLRRVERIINEKTGRMMELPGDCIILDDIVCAGVYHQYCPRNIYPYWREIWLRRVEQPRSANVDSLD